MTLCILTSALLTQALIAGFSYTLNVTVSPSPWVLHPVGENASLWCSVSQRKRRDSLLTVRWVFSPSSGHEQIIGRITKFGTTHISGNWSRRGDLSSEHPGRLYRLTLSNVQHSDQGHYTCRVQEVAQHRSRWTAVSNGTAVTQLRVLSHTVSDEKLFTWNLFQDLYLYAVLLCSVGILSLLVFFIILLCQTIFHKRRSKVKWKCPHESVNGRQSVTDLLSPLPPKKKKRKKPQQVEIPPELPVKGPLISLVQEKQRPLLLPRLVEEGLAYAELELVKPSPPVKETPSTTVYAQILFEESSLQHDVRSKGQRGPIISPNKGTIQGPMVPRLYSTIQIP
ncbi:V-set and transmembrane domain-containing protein 4 isoform X2 [Bombina bombina]|uniref:V-set and transmembrane domain-containing protein 4 isoform X2 n=1 Tax=Bombina bombina TaxID=8345 RepID=UPI00235AE46E|nr:V-set and transmembrane domain-containing protein 4 isoform X2 [Bombina bombina]